MGLARLLEQGTKYVFWFLLNYNDWRTQGRYANDHYESFGLLLNFASTMAAEYYYFNYHYPPCIALCTSNPLHKATLQMIIVIINVH